MGVPTLSDLKKALSTKLISNSKVTCEDVDLAQSLFSNDTITKKGKTIRKNSKKMLHDRISIPEELIHQNKNVHLSIDTININGLMFFTSISHNIYYRSAQYVPNKQQQNYSNCLE